jgi:hypothetical protein
MPWRELEEARHPFDNAMRAEPASSPGTASVRPDQVFAMGSDRLPRSEQIMRSTMQGFASGVGDTHQLAELDAGLFIARDDVRLHHHAHVLLQRECRGMAGGAASRSEDGREVPAAIAVH